jgi:hypothetical protein
LARLKNGVCECKVLENGIVVPGRSIRLYYEGLIHEDRLISEIIPDIKDHLNGGWYGKFPMAIYNYYSVPYPYLSVIYSKGGSRFKPARPKPETKSYDWLVTDDGKTFKINQMKIVSE